MRGIPAFHSIACALACLFAASLNSVAHADPTTVRIDSGLVRGAVADDVASFKGIPYAKPPIGPLRWRAPQPAVAWRGVRDATKFAPECMQTDDVPKSEDCLTLNVWRPAEPRRADCR